MVESSGMSKKELIEAWSQEIQRAGTINVLHTNAVAQRIGLSATEFEAIDVITRNQPITAGQLAVFCGLTTGAITGLIDRLEVAGFIRRVSDSSDRRKVLLEPIEDGARSKKIRALYEPIAIGFEDIAQRYTVDELEFLVESQTRLNTMAQGVIEKLHEIK
jgi:DNA-binding MarR family transcriptional regulator